MSKEEIKCQILSTESICSIAVESLPGASSKCSCLLKARRQDRFSCFSYSYSYSRGEAEKQGECLCKSQMMIKVAPWTLGHIHLLFKNQDSNQQGEIHEHSRQIYKGFGLGNIYLFEAAQKEQRLGDACCTSSGSTVHRDILAINFQCEPAIFPFFKDNKQFSNMPTRRKIQGLHFYKEAVSLKSHPPFFFLHDRSLPRAFLKMHQGHLKLLPVSPNSFSLEGNSQSTKKNKP